MKFKKGILGLLATIVTAAMFSTAALAAETKTLPSMPVQRIQSDTYNAKYIKENTGVITSDELDDVNEVLPRLTPDQLKKIDKLVIREVVIMPKWRADDGEEYAGGPYKLVSSWNVNQQSLLLSVTPAERAQMDEFAQTEGTLTGYFMLTRFEVTGEGPTSRRRVVTRIPSNVNTVTGIKNGIWEIGFDSSVDKPNCRWEGYFEYWQQYDSPGLRTTWLNASTTFSK